MSTPEPDLSKLRDTKLAKQLNASEFSVKEAMGGVRGVIESIGPGLVFVLVFLLASSLQWALMSSAGVALLAVIGRLLTRTPPTQALAGVFGVAIATFWAWRTGRGEDYFQFGLWTNAAYLVPFVISIAIRYPLVGVLVSLLRQEDFSWRRGEEERGLRKRYYLATWLWIGMFALRLAVKLPLFIQGAVGWLGTFHLLLGVPLFALVLWGTWVLLRRPTQDSATE